MIELKVLKLIALSELNDWSILSYYTTYIEQNRNKLLSLNNFLTRVKENVEIQNNIEYKRVTIKLYNGGVFLRDKLKGKEIGTKNQFLIREGQLLLSKIDARNGAFGIVPKNLDGAVITGNFWVFDIDKDKIIPDVLSLILSSKRFQAIWDACSNGATNRHYLQEKAFLNAKIPVPSIPEQERLISDYNSIYDKGIYLLSTKEKEHSLAYYLGIEKIEFINQKAKIKVVNFSGLMNRWQMNADIILFRKELEKGKFKVKNLGAFLNIISSSWKKECEKDYDYIEMSNIDADFNTIRDCKKINRDNAPSRATQIVHAGDLIFGTTRPYLNKIAIIPPELDGAVCSSAFIIIGQSEQYDLRYIINILVSEYVGMQYDYLMTGALYPAITNKDFEEIVIPLPPIDIQKKIAQEFENYKYKQMEDTEIGNNMLKKAKLDFEYAIFN